MSTVSDSYINAIYNSDVIPKCDIKIEILAQVKTISKQTRSIVLGNEQISSFSFKKAGDILSNELPSLECEFEEQKQISTKTVTTEGGSAKNEIEYDFAHFPNGDSAVTGIYAVDVSFKQYLMIDNTWANVANSTWTEVSKMTWDELETAAPYETIKLPRMYVAVAPTIDGDVRKWKAVGLLNFLNSETDKYYNANGITIAGTNYPPRAHAIVANAIQDGRGAVGRLKNWLIAIEMTDFMKSAYNTFPKSTLDFNAHIKGNVSDVVRNACAFYNRVIKYTSEGTRIGNASFSTTPNRQFTRDLLFSDPEVTEISPVKNYKYTRNIVTLDDSASYQKISPSEFSELPNYTDNKGKTKRIWKLVYKLNDAPYATMINSIEPAGRLQSVDIHEFGSCPKMVCFITNQVSNLQQSDINALSSLQCQYQPLKTTTYSETKTLQEQGKNDFEENNPFCAVYSLKDASAVINERANNIKKRYKEGNFEISFESVADPSIELFDTISVVTDYSETFDDNGEGTETTTATKNIVVIEQELTYTGLLNQKIKGVQFG